MLVPMLAVVSALLTLVGVVVMLVVMLRLQRRLTRMIARLNWYEKNYLLLRGSRSGVGNYSYVSLDAGRNWFAFEDLPGNGGVRVTGPADPAQLAKVQGMRALLDHIAQHGSLDPTDPAALQMLMQAGITVTGA